MLPSKKIFLVLTLFLSSLLMHQTIFAEGSPITLKGTDGKTVTFPYYLQFVSKLISKKITDSSGTLKEPIPASVSSKTLTQLHHYILKLPQTAKNLSSKGRPYMPHVDEINEQTIFVNPLIKSVIRKRSTIDKKWLIPLLDISHYLQIDCLVNAFASVIPIELEESEQLDISYEQKKYIKKHLYLNERHIRELSVSDYFALYGLPKRTHLHKYKASPKVYYDMTSKRIVMNHLFLTSLNGLDILEKYPYPIEGLELANNHILHEELNPNFMESPFKTFKQLKYLSLNNTGLSFVPEHYFKGAHSLLHLSLSNNKLSSLPEEIFTPLPQLQTLDLSNNELTMLPRMDLPHLKILDLAANHLSTLHCDAFQHVTQLRKLNLASNQLSVLPKCILYGLVYLNDLNLSSNQLVTLPKGFFQDLMNLHTLSLNKNELTNTLDPNIFTCLLKLKKMDISDNHFIFEEGYLNYGDTFQFRKQYNLLKNTTILVEFKPQKLDRIEIEPKLYRWYKGIVNPFKRAFRSGPPHENFITKR